MSTSNKGEEEEEETTTSSGDENKTTTTKKTNIIYTHKKSQDATLWECVLGWYCITSFLIIWVSSLLSPFLLIYSLMHGHYKSGAIIIFLTTLAYLPWKGKNSSFIQGTRHLYQHYHPYYYKELKVVFEDCLPDDKQGDGDQQNNKKRTFYAVHPHGTFCIGWAQIFTLPLLEDTVKFCFAPALYASPFFRLFSRIVGNPGSASKDSMISYMKSNAKENTHLALIPGGFEEATTTCLTQDRVYIRKRTGFIRLCLQHGITEIRPVYVFGEKSLYWNIQGGWNWRLACNRLWNLPTILPYGHWLFPLLPKNYPTKQNPTTGNIYIVVGTPMELPLIANPTKEQVQQWHEKYIVALQRLFEDHKEDAYGSELAKITKLEVW